MLESVRMFFTICLAIICMVVYPTVVISDNAFEDAKEFTRAATQDFVNKVRNKGYVDNRDYSDFINKINSTSYTFDVEMEHYNKTYEPLYGDPNNFYTFTGNFEVIYEGYYTNEILEIIYDTSYPEHDPRRRYNMKEGDLFNVRIYSEKRSVGSIIKGVLTREVKDVIAYRYGGMIRNEAP